MYDIISEMCKIRLEMVFICKFELGVITKLLTQIKATVCNIHGVFSHKDK